MQYVVHFQYCEIVASRIAFVVTSLIVGALYKGDRLSTFEAKECRNRCGSFIRNINVYTIVDKVMYVLSSVALWNTTYQPS